MRRAMIFLFVALFFCFFIFFSTFWLEKSLRWPVDGQIVYYDGVGQFLKEPIFAPYGFVNRGRITRRSVIKISVPSYIEVLSERKYPEKRKSGWQLYKTSDVLDATELSDFKINGWVYYGAEYLGYITFYIKPMYLKDYDAVQEKADTVNSVVLEKLENPESVVSELKEKINFILGMAEDEGVVEVVFGKD